MAKAKKSAKKVSKAAKPVKAPKVVKVNIPKKPANATSKSGIIATCAIAAGISGQQAKTYYDALTDGAYANLKKDGKFLLGR